MSPCKLFVALNIAALITALAGLAAGSPGGLPLMATGLIVWALARTQLKKC